MQHNNTIHPETSLTKQAHGKMQEPMCFRGGFKQRILADFLSGETTADIQKY